MVTIKRFANNPLLSPASLRPSRPDFEVTCVLNPGAFRHGGRVGLLLRVAERPVPVAGEISTPLYDHASGEIKCLRLKLGAPGLEVPEDEPRVFTYEGRAYLTTMSHLLPAWSDDGGRTFTPDYDGRLFPASPLEGYGVEDARVTCIDGEYLITYTAVSESGVAVGMRRTRDWKTFSAPEVIFPPHNKDCAIFPRRVGGRYWALHRPSGAGIGGNYIWLAQSPDLRHWGDHRCLAACRPGAWDAERVGAGAEPIETPHGWLEVYHGADGSGRYCLGLLLLDRDAPWKVLARSRAPVMEPAEPYERSGFYGNCIFTNGHVVDGDRLLVYYGAADAVVCGAEFSLAELTAAALADRV